MTDAYDLIVVGAGSAGGVISSRVTENEGLRVLLVEAGPDYPDLAALPGDLRNGNDNSYTAHDWGFTYTPGPLTPEQPFPRGKVVGGSSAVNTCIALRGEQHDYDEWASLVGDEWSWERCLPAFRRLEADGDFGAADYHGADGPLPINRYTPQQLLPIQAAFLEGAREAGFPDCPDHNAPGATGAGPTPLNKRGPNRVSVAEAFVHPARVRPNLTIRPNTLVHRVVIEHGAVRGIETDGGEVIPGRNVVLCAGSIMSPAILVRSGIGPRATLERLGVPVVAHLPVGERLQDHPATAVLCRSKPGLVDPSGPIMQTCMRYTVEHHNDMFVEPMSFVPWFGRDPSFVAIAASVYRSRGSGCLRFESADASAAPAIESKFYEDGEDIELILHGTRTATEIAHTKAVGEAIEEVIGPAPEVVADDDKLREHVQRFCGSGYHPCGTAAMGHVVDQYGRVPGVGGLRVADASIMPTVPSANINIPTIMIGERFGEWLRTELG